MGKKSFMVEFELPEELSTDFLERIPDQHAFIDQLMVQGKVRSYSLAIDRSVLWVIMEAESEFEIMEIIVSMPLCDYMQPYVSELMFHQSTEVYRQFSLN
ncbi:MAG: muconolactone Delta-isomerase family protein [Haliscomenobacter sp.]